MKPHVRKIRGVWTVRLCERVPCLPRPPLFANRVTIFPLDSPMGHGYTVREACEDWKAQMKGRA